MSESMALDDHEAWRDDALATILGLAQAHPVFSADDLAREMRKPPSDKMPGQAFARARKLGYIEPVGHTTSRTRSRKNGSIRTWRLASTERNAA